MKIALSAGEESGDILGSDLMRSLKAHDDKIEFIGIGGERMKKNGNHRSFTLIKDHIEKKKAVNKFF